MRFAHVSGLEAFGTRSVVIHGIMVIAFANAVLVGLFVQTQVGLISFVALLNFTAGLWVAHSIHSLGTTARGTEYSGVLDELRGDTTTDTATSDTETPANDSDLDTATPADNSDPDIETADAGFRSGRFGRILALIAAVTAIALLTSAQALSGAVFSVAIVAIGAIAVLTAMTGFLIAMGASYDAAQASVDTR